MLDGGPGDDRVDGGARGDILIGGAGDDLMEAQAGDDVVWGDGGGGDAADGDDGADSGDADPDADSGLESQVLQAFPGGYIASVEIDPGEVNGGEGFTAFAASVDAGGGGRVVNGWSSDLNAPLTFATSGDAGTFSNADVWRRALDADDSFTLTYQAQGGTPDDDTISFEVIDRQAADSAGVAADVQVTDHGGTVVVNVTVTNPGATAIDDWTLELAFNGALSVDHVWGASGSSPDPQTVILDAVAENGALAAGATLEAGFVASDAGGAAARIQLLDQDFI